MDGGFAAPLDSLPRREDASPGDAETAAPPQTGPDEAASSAEGSAGAGQVAPEAGGEADQSASSPEAAEAAAPQQAAPVAPPEAPVAAPAAFDADVNVNVRQTRVAHLELGPSSLGLGFRDGILTATLGGMELYDGHATGKIVLDAAKPVPTFTGDFRLDGVEAKSLLSDAAQFSMLSGKTKLALQLNGTGSSADEIKSSLTGQGSLAVSDGAIEGINLTEMISSIGEGQIPDVRQGPGAKTAFSDLGGSFTIANGIMETNNLQMTSPLLKVAAAGKVDIAQSTIDILANPEIVAGPEGKSGANDLAGLSVPVRIEGPLDSPKIKPELKGMFSSPEQANKTVKQIGDVIKQVNDISNTIATAVEEQTATTTEIASNVSEAAKGAAEIATNITGVAEAANASLAKGNAVDAVCAGVIAQLHATQCSKPLSRAVKRARRSQV